MTHPRISMHRLQELVRLHRMGHTPSQVARLLSLTRKTERRYRNAFLHLDLLHGDPQDLPSMETLQDALHQHPDFYKARPSPVSTAEPWRERIETLSQNDASPKAVYDALCREGSGSSTPFTASYHAVRRLVLRLRKGQAVRPEDVAVPRVTTPGLEAQVDFGYVGRVFDPQTRRHRRAWVFVMTLSYSRHRVDLLVFDQSTDTWIDCQREAFRRLGGVPKTVVPDNLKAAVIRRAFESQEDTQLNRTYREFARHYGFKVDPTPVRDPKKKGGVESGVRYVKNNFFKTRQLDREDADLLRAELDRWTHETAGQRTHGTTRRRPLMAFEQEERQALQPLPQRSFEGGKWSKHTVHRDSHVRVGQAFYSVPFRLLGQEVWVYATRASVVVYADNRRVATHARVGAGERSTVEADLPETRVPYRHRDPRHWRERAERIGAEALRYVESILEQDEVLSYLGHAQRVVLALEAVPQERAEAACRRALHFGNLRPKAIERILEEGLDQEPLPAEPVVEPTPGRFARDLQALAASACARGVA